MKISMISQGDQAHLQSDLLRLARTLPEWAPAELKADMGALRTAMHMLEDDVMPDLAELEQAAECVTGILSNRWPMAGSAAQWPIAKKVLRDAQVAIEGYTAGAQLQKRVANSVKQAREHARQDASTTSMDVRTRVTSVLGHLSTISNLLLAATPLSE
eukprot:228695-Pyramimonas_sp.AAC.1